MSGVLHSRHLIDHPAAVKLERSGKMVGSITCHMDKIKTRWKNTPYTLQRIVFLLAMLAFLASVIYIAAGVERNNTATAKIRFENAIENKLEQLSYRIETYTDILYSERALLTIKPSTTRAEWSIFLEGQKIKERYPGAYGVGYVRMDDNKAVLTYLAPEDATDQTVVGYDLFSNATRKTVLEMARDTGLAKATPPITLVTDKSGDPPSLLIALPVYDQTHPLKSVEDRRDALTGYVTVALHSQPLLDSIFTNDTNYDEIAVRIRTNDQQLYQRGETSAAGHLEKQVNIDVAGQTWHIVFNAPKTFGVSKTGTIAPDFFTLVGFTFALVLLLVFWYSIRLKGSRS